MYSRILKLPARKSCFLFGARGTGKSTYLKSQYPDADYIDLLDEETALRLTAEPNRLVDYLSVKLSGPVIIDEIQRVPELLNEIHRLIENDKRHFIMTGSSARKLKKSHANLLAGRALRYEMFPLTSLELGKDFGLTTALRFGMLPARFSEENPQKYLSSYLSLYIREEVQMERLTRNLSAFHRFLEAASFSQAQPLVITKVAADCHVERKTVEEYFNILEDLLLAFRLPVFSKRAKRELLNKDKFFFFDTGLYQTIRPRGPLDSESEINGPGLETLVVQEIRALNALLDLGYTLYHWRTKSKHEVDLILYGEKGLYAIEIKNSVRVRDEDLAGLKLFCSDYPVARAYLLYGGTRRQKVDGIECIPVQDFFSQGAPVFFDV